jgi:hypothetical protein
MENTSSSVVLFTPRCTKRKLFDCFLRIRCLGYVFTESLPSNGFTYHNMYALLIVNVKPTINCSGNDRIKHIWRLKEEPYLLWRNRIYFFEIQPMFRKNMSPPSSGSERNKTRKQQGADLAICFILMMKLEAMNFSETQVEFRRTTLSYLPQHGTLHDHCD